MIKKTFNHRHKEDIIRIKQIMLNNGYEADLSDAAELWEDYSDSLAAGWINLPKDDDELWSIIKYDVEDKAVN